VDRVAFKPRLVAEALKLVSRIFTENENSQALQRSCRFLEVRACQPHGALHSCDHRAPAGRSTLTVRHISRCRSATPSTITLCRSESRVTTCREDRVGPVRALRSIIRTSTLDCSAGTVETTCWDWSLATRRRQPGRWTALRSCRRTTSTLRGPTSRDRRVVGSFYLSWGTVEGDAFTLFRRAKLRFDAIPPHVMRDAVGLGMLVGRLGLTDRKGNPLCAAVRPPTIEWLAAAK
jgi:hypothetical protein